MDPAIKAAMITAFAIILAPVLAVFLQYFLERLKRVQGDNGSRKSPQTPPPKQEKTWLMNMRHRFATWSTSFIRFSRTMILPWLTPLGWFLVLSMVLYVFMTVLFLFMPGSLSLEGPTEDYIREVPWGETATAEAIVVVRDLSARGWFFRNLFPAFLILGQLKVEPMEAGGQIRVVERPDANNADPTNSFILKKYPGAAIAIQYVFKKEQDVGHVQLSLYDFRDNANQASPKQSRIVSFFKKPL